MPVYDDQKPTHDSHDYPLVGGDARFDEKKKKSLDGDELQNAENQAGQDSSGSIDQKEQSLLSSESDRLGKGYSGKDKKRGLFGKGGRLSFGKWTRKKTAAAAAATIVGAGGIFGLSVLQGPFQFVHFAQMLQKFHLQRNEDFGDSRTSKILLYSLSGRGVQNARLGVKGNIAANAWENRLLERTGMRPIYDSKTGRFVGFEIVNENKAHETLGSAGNQKGYSAKRVEQSMGKGAEIRSAKDLGTTPVDAKNNPLDNNSRVVYLKNVSSADRRVWIRTIGQSTDTWRVSSAIGSRLLVKRGGVDFHPMNKLKDRLESSADSRKSKQTAEEEIDKERAEEITHGIDVPDGVEAGKSQDDNGDGVGDTSTSEDENLSNETKSLLDDFKKTGVLKTGASAAAVAGALCAAKSYGTQIQNYRFENNILPMMRLGINAVATGNQVMSNDDFDMDSLKVASKYLYDKDSKTSWSAAESIRAEQGKTGGVPMPQEADLSTAGGKPKLFRVLDQIPGLGTTCKIQDAIFNLPGIKQVSGLISDITTGALDASLSAFGTDTDTLLLASMKTISGKSVDPNAKGADFGNLANTGTFLAANDQAISTGGTAMSQQSAMELRNYQDSFEKQDQQNKSFAQRYLDPKSSTSFIGSTIDKTPLSLSAFATSVGGSVKNLSPTTFLASLPIFGKTAQAASSYDYGTPEYGFTVSEQNDDRFENPYDNAAIVEPRLDDLNNKYGDCFNMKITVDDSGPHIESGKSVNSFDIAGKSECQRGSEEFLRYRFYIADVVNTLSIACYEGDNDSCVEVGISGSGGSSSEGAGTAVSGDAKTLAQQILDNDDITKQPNPKSSLEAAAKGDKSPAGVDQCGKQHEAVALDPKLLGFLAELGTQDSFTITSLTTGAHSCSSNHYKGVAVDFGCDLDTTKADRIGKKYGISHNFENCANDAHWHYSIGGS